MRCIGWISTKHCSTESDVFKNHYESKKFIQMLTIACHDWHKDCLGWNQTKVPDGPDQTVYTSKSLKDGDVVSHCSYNLLFYHQQLRSHWYEICQSNTLFKKNSRSDIGNYMPVSISSIASLRQQFILPTWRVYFWEEKKMIYSLQSDFSGSYSTKSDTCLIYLTHYIRSQMTACEYTDMVLLDLQKAFGTQ